MSINNNKKKERIGVTNVNNQGLIMKVIDYKNTHHVSILFEDGSIVNTEWRSFENATVRNLNYPITRNKGKKTNRKGEENINHQGCVMRIIQYNNANDLMVQFDDNSDHISKCWNGLEKKNKCLGTYNNEYDAFLAYKHYKEKLIKETAEIEYKNGIITKACRDALFNYEVEITD